MPATIKKKPTTKKKKKYCLGPHQEKFVKLLEKSQELQIYGALKRGQNYCAVGIAHVASGDPRVGSSDKVRNFLDFTPTARSAIIYMNDINRLSFKKIAAAIRKNPPKFFDRPK